MSDFARIQRIVEAVDSIETRGSVSALRGLTLLVDALPATVGSLVSVETGRCDARQRVPGQVVGFDAGQSIVMLLGSSAGVRPGDRVLSKQTLPTVGAGDGLLG